MRYLGLGVKEKEAELWWQQGVKRGMMGYRVPPGASPKLLQQLPTKADIPGPFNGCQMTIHDAH
jgi:hypothetical protein